MSNNTTILFMIFLNKLKTGKDKYTPMIWPMGMNATKFTIIRVNNTPIVDTIPFLASPDTRNTLDEGLSPFTPSQSCKQSSRLQHQVIPVPMQI